MTGNCFHLPENIELNTQARAISIDFRYYVTVDDLEQCERTV